MELGRSEWVWVCKDGFSWVWVSMGEFRWVLGKLV